MRNLRINRPGHFSGRWLAAVLLLIGVNIDAADAVGQTTQPPELGAPKSLLTSPPKAVSSEQSQTPSTEQPAPAQPVPAQPVPAQPVPGQPVPADDQNLADEKPPQDAAKVQKTTAKNQLIFKNLETPSVATIGTLRADNGGFDLDLWQGTSSDVAQSLLSRVQNSTPSATVNRLLRRVLQAAGTPPDGDQTEDGAEKFFLLRVQALVQLGAIDDAVNLMLAVPKGSRTAAFTKQVTEIAFLRPDPNRACAEVRRMLTSSDDLFWLRAGIVCDTLDGRLERVELDSRLLNELGAVDRRFNLLVTALLSGEKPTIKDADSLAPESFALAGLVAGERLVTDVDQVAPKWLTALATAPSTPFNLRLQLAERAVTLGLMTAAELQALYQEVKVNDTRLDQLLTLVENDPDVQASALLFRAAETQQSALARAQLITQALSLAEKRKNTRALAAPLAEVVIEMPVISQLEWFAATAVRILIAANRGGEAAEWSRLASRAKPPEQQLAWVRLWPLTYLANGPDMTPWDADLIDQWWQLDQDGQTADMAKKKMTLLAFLQTTGATISDDVWRTMVTSPTRRQLVTMPLSLRRAIGAGVREKRFAETILLTAIALSGGSFEVFARSDLVFLITALRDLGLAAEARQLAMEVALADGL